MRPLKTIVLGVATSFLVVMGSTGMARECAESYNRIPMYAYQNFLINWDEQAEPRFYALIRTPQEYDQVFHPAPIAGDPRPFHPEASLYEKSQILMVAHVFAASPDPSKADRIFEVERVTTKAGELTLRYRLKRPKSDVDAAQFKFFLAIQVPRANYRKVTIFEDGKLVGQLKPSEGLWTVPKPAPE
ncbi:hypothetical protein NDA01_24060 [Trichocoleus desertorum AS-A10]|uniref:hypothetical protein n=1 Tax=Trichocoleus desertorum TaxID=1481672 RepID=UPI003299DA6F